MKKVSILIVFLLGVTFNSFSQSADFFAGKWEITVVGTPNGDAKFSTELIRKDGKLGGELKIVSTEKTDPVAITNIDESADKITIYFSTQGYDVNVVLEKVDSDNLKGSLMNMFESTAKRVKE